MTERPIGARRTVLAHLDAAITVDADERVLRDATLVVEGDRIAAVGPAATVAVGPDDVVIDARGLAVVPGFVDTHVHLSETLSRGSFPDRLGTRAWVFHWVMPYYGELTVEDERVAVQLAAAEMLRNGTTCFLDMGALNDPRVTVPALAAIGIRGITSRHAADTPPDPIPEGWSPAMVAHHFFPSTAAALVELEACVRELDGAAGGRIRVWANIQGKEPCSAELHLGARELAERLGVGTTYHIASTTTETAGVRTRHGLTPVARIASLGGLGSNLVLAHAVAVDDAEIALLAEHGTKVAFCPGTALKLGKGATRVGRYPEMLDAGVVVGLGTDGVSASGNLSLMRQLHLVAGLFKDARMDPEAIGARRALRMATIDGARALGWDHEIGSLEPGKKADFVLFDLDHPEWVPCGDPVQVLVWSATPASIAQTWVDGVPVYVDGAVRTLTDERGLRAEARARAAAVLRRAGLDRGEGPLVTSTYA